MRIASRHIITKYLKIVIKRKILRAFIEKKKIIYRGKKGWYKLFDGNNIRKQLNNIIKVLERKDCQLRNLCPGGTFQKLWQHKCLVLARDGAKWVKTVTQSQEEKKNVKGIPSSRRKNDARWELGLYWGTEIIRNGNYIGKYIKFILHSTNVLK